MKTFKTSGYLMFLIIALLILVIAGCARSESVDQCLTGHTYGFLGGLWHGFIAPFDFVGMLFNKEITMYAQNNNGGLYALGFLLGSGGWGFFGGRGVKRVKHYHTHIHRGDSRNFDEAEVVD